jgi:hypothetical protein
VRPARRPRSWTSGTRRGSASRPARRWLLRSLGPVRRAPRVLTCVVATAAGAAAGLLGSFCYAATRSGAPVGLLLALLLSTAVFVTCGLATRGRLAPALAAVGWVVVVVLLSIRRPEGDLVVTGTLLGSLWLLAGSVLAGSAAAWPYAVRPGDGPLRPRRRPASEVPGSGR